MCAASYIGRQTRIVGEFAIRPVNQLPRGALDEDRRTKSPYFAIPGHGGIMKKSIIIVVLCLLQCACATRETVPASGNSLLSFETISAEITVSHEQTEAAADLSQTVALNTDN
jgi:hypothetical protein